MTDTSTAAAGGNNYKDSKDVLRAVKETHSILLASFTRAGFWWLRSWFAASLYAIISSFCLMAGIVGVLYFAFGPVPEFMLGKYGIGFWAAMFAALWCLLGPTLYFRVFKNSWLAKAASRDLRDPNEAINMTLERRRKKDEAAASKKAAASNPNPDR